MEERVHNQTQKIVLNNGFYDELIEAIQVNNDFANNLPEESRKVIVDRNVRIQDNLDKKINEDNEVYYYFYQRELKDLFWILIENYTNLKK